ncbi:MAG: nuclear transport factor 2 family protein [Planctomycetota bacterium]|jgi:ketosteroid isomerase-like protein
MPTRTFVAGLAAGCLVSLLVAAALPPASGNQPVARLALHELQSDFHEAGVVGDYEMMRALWTDDAVYTNPLGTIEGGDAIAAFFASGPLWGHQVSLAPSYKTEYDIQGSRAEFTFECVVLSVPGDAALTMSLVGSSGRQDTEPEIVQHIQATGTMVRQNGRWMFQEFTGSLMPTEP